MGSLGSPALSLTLKFWELASLHNHVTYLFLTLFLYLYVVLGLFLENSDEYIYLFMCLVPKSNLSRIEDIALSSLFYLPQSTDEENEGSRSKLMYFRVIRSYTWWKKGLKSGNLMLYFTYLTTILYSLEVTY